jgi:hypothetical protein
MRCSRRPRRGTGIFTGSRGDVEARAPAVNNNQAPSARAAMPIIVRNAAKAVSSAKSLARATAPRISGLLMIAVCALYVHFLFPVNRDHQGVVSQFAELNDLS